MHIGGVLLNSNSIFNDPALFLQVPSILFSNKLLLLLKIKFGGSEKTTNKLRPWARRRTKPSPAPPGTARFPRGKAPRTPGGGGGAWPGLANQGEAREFRTQGGKGALPLGLRWVLPLGFFFFFPSFLLFFLLFLNFTLAMYCY